jgi:hypothetical protein
MASNNLRLNLRKDAVEPKIPNLLAAILPVLAAFAIVMIDGQAIHHYTGFAAPLKVSALSSGSPTDQRTSGQSADGQNAGAQAAPRWHCADMMRTGDKRISACASAAKSGAMHSGVVILLLAFAGAALVAAYSVVSQSVSRRRQTGLVAVGVAIVLMGGLTYWFLSGDPLYERLAGGILSSTLLHIDHPWVAHSMVVAYLAAAFGGSLVAAGCAAAAYDAIVSATEADAATAPNAALRLGRCVSALQTMTTIGALVLVAGVASVALYFNWGRSFVADEAATITYQAVTDGIVTLHGATYTTALFIIFYGGITLLKSRAVFLARTANKEKPGDMDAFFKENGLVFSTPTYLKDALKVAAPLIAAAYAEPLAKILGA